MRDGAKVGVKEAGFIAQELLAVTEKYGVKDWLPLVLERNPEKLEATPGRLIPVIVRAIQELADEIDKLKNK
jgi:hypothetical protein